MGKVRKEAIHTEWAADIADLGNQRIAGGPLNAVIYQELLRQHLVPWVKRTYPGRKHLIQRICTDPQRQDLPAIEGILDLDR